MVGYRFLQALQGWHRRGLNIGCIYWSVSRVVLVEVQSQTGNRTLLRLQTQGKEFAGVRYGPNDVKSRTHP